jgi:acetoacetyl-CoA synthetase
MRLSSEQASPLVRRSWIEPMNENSEAITTGAALDQASQRSGSLRVRPVEEADIPGICAFLHRTWSSKIDWRALFDYRWLADKPDLGYVLVRGEEIVGFLGAVYAQRWVNDRPHLVCNISTWYVREGERRGSLPLLLALLRKRDCSFTNLSANPDAFILFQRCGFQPLGDSETYHFPLLHLPTLWAGGRARVIDDRLELRALLSEEHRRIHDDHASYPCCHLALTEVDRYAYIVSKRRIRRGVPTAELLYCSAPELLRRHFERIKLHILWRQRAFALVIDTRLLGDRLRWGYCRPRLTMFRSSVLAPEDIDYLYSEFVLLPI